jgi:hypothetical protein
MLHVISLVLFLSIGAANAVEPTTTTPAKLPRIVVDAANKGFVDSDGERFIPCGVNYYRPDTGWAPQFWKKLDVETTRRDFQKMKDMGINVARVFVTYGSFYSQPGQLDPEGLAKFDQLLDIADEFGIYIHPTGPEGWEGMPEWTHKLGNAHANLGNEDLLKALEDYWKMFAGRYRGRNTIWSYDLKNEPSVEWDTPESRVKWDQWRTKHSQPIVPVPARDSEPSEVLADYQRFRESLAVEWVARQSKAIKAADPEALVTAGLLQWSIPAKELESSAQYAAFRPELIAPHLDFMSLHFYPLANGVYKYDGEAAEDANLAMLESMVRECAKPGKPVVIGEFGWYGGGPLDPGGKPASEEDQARWGKRFVEVTAPMTAGWLNWGLYDTPTATDVSRLTGFLTVDGKDKVWGKVFAPLVKSIAPPAQIPVRPDLPWDTAPSDKAAAGHFQKEYLKAFLEAKPQAKGQ